jgi:hypothetical protein
VKIFEPKKPESTTFSHFFGSFYLLPADFRLIIPMRTKKGFKVNAGEARFG